MIKEKDCIELKITLNETRPIVWRKIVVPATITFGKLHRIIQYTMGWEGYHLYDFIVAGVRYGGPDEFGFDTAPVKSLNSRLSKALDGVRSFKYIYDYGDNWVHKVQVGRKYKVPADFSLPLCLDGENACPPEDCGGVWGFDELKEIIADETHEEHELKLEWVGEEYDYTKFDILEANNFLRNMR